MPTFQSLFDDNREALKLSWIAGQAAADRPLDTPATAGLASADLVGHLNLIHPNRLHVLGGGRGPLLQHDGVGAASALRQRTDLRPARSDWSSVKV